MMNVMIQKETIVVYFKVLCRYSYRLWRDGQSEIKLQYKPISLYPVSEHILKLYWYTGLCDST
jgi:hypothetical protein